MRERPPRERRREEVAAAGSGTETVNEVEADGVSTSAPPDVGTGELNTKGIPEYVAGVEMSGETGGTYDNITTSQLLKASPKANPWNVAAA
jgi:hypothetical protein